MSSVEKNKPKTDEINFKQKKSVSNLRSKTIATATQTTITNTKVIKKTIVTHGNPSIKIKTKAIIEQFIVFREGKINQDIKNNLIFY